VPQEGEGGERGAHGLRGTARRQAKQGQGDERAQTRSVWHRKEVSIVLEGGERGAQARTECVVPQEGGEGDERTQSACCCRKV
jgi:hypothetical protein